jgi:dihydrodipicolinate synthase/N-acetylneuraminate lyase
MSLGVTLREAEEKTDKPAGFFPQLYENVCKQLSSENFDTLQKIKDDQEQFLRLVSNVMNTVFAVFYHIL